jgi:hypothetical protein
MIRLMLQTSLAGAAIFAGALLAHAQPVPPAGPPAQATPIPDDRGGSVDIPATPPPPVLPAPDDDDVDED